MSSPRPRRSPRGYAGVAVLAAVLTASGLTGCSSGEGELDDEPSQASSQAVPTPSNAAEEAVVAGLAKHVEGDLDGAGVEYRKALDTDPTNVLALYNLGLISQTRGQDEAAVESYRQVLEIDPDYQPAVFNLAILRKAEGKSAEAERLYRRAIALRPGDAGAHLNLGLLLRENGQQQEGDAEVATALKLNPQLVDPAAR